VKVGDELAYDSERRSGERLTRRCAAASATCSPEPQLGSLEFFLLERYYLYNVRGGKLHRGQVHHVPYPAHVAEVLSVSDGLDRRRGAARRDARVHPCWRTTRPAWTWRSSP
jgi:uncharacterized protein YqjF (DUF2071 family)